MYAIIETGGKQYRVQPGDVLDVERLEGDASEDITFNKVLALNTGEGLTVGKPLVVDATVTAELLEHVRGKKVTVFKLKRRKGYRRKQGHRQELSRVRIKDIAAGA